MDQLLDPKRLIDLILILVAVEALVLFVLPRFLPQMWRLDLAHAAYLWPTIVSGAFLMLAVRLATSDAAWPWILCLLSASGVFHALDVALRLKLMAGKS